MIDEVLKEFLNINQLINSISYVFIIYFWFKINYEIKALKENISLLNEKIENHIKSIKNEIELKDKKINLISQKFLTEIEEIKTKMK